MNRNYQEHHFRDQHLFFNYSFEYYGSNKYFKDTNPDGHNHEFIIEEHHHVHIYYSREDKSITDGSLPRFIRHCFDVTGNPVYIHIPKDCHYLENILKEVLVIIGKSNPRYKKVGKIIREHRGVITRYFFGITRNFNEQRYERIFRAVGWDGDRIRISYVHYHERYRDQFISESSGLYI